MRASNQIDTNRAILYGGQSLALEVLHNAAVLRAGWSQEDKVRWWAGFFGGTVASAAAEIGHETTEMLRGLIPVAAQIAKDHGR